MKLQYVGAMPLISDKGVGFDQTQPDKYTFLNAAVELLEALDFGATPTTQHLHNISGKEYSGDELISILKKHCEKIDEINEESDKKAHQLKDDLINRVNENKNLHADARTAWLNNIELMSEYYFQYVSNESAYACALDSLAQEIHVAKIKEVSFPMFRNYGLVLHDLDYVLRHKKSPIDSNLTIEPSREGVLIGKLTISHR